MFLCVDFDNMVDVGFVVLLQLLNRDDSHDEDSESSKARSPLHLAVSPQHTHTKASVAVQVVFLTSLM